jgi:hypothetical protein
MGLRGTIERHGKRQVLVLRVVTLSAAFSVELDECDVELAA